MNKAVKICVTGVSVEKRRAVQKPYSQATREFLPLELDQLAYNVQNSLSVLSFCNITVTVTEIKPK
jgi:hypothetical protein